VYVTDSGPVALRDPHVETTFDLPSLAVAHVTVSAEAWNTTDRAVKATVAGGFEGVRFETAGELGPHERKTVRFTPADTPALDVGNPRVWWPYRMGEPALHTLEMEATVDGARSDRARTRFGLRQVTSELTAQGHRLFRVNGRPVLVRGGGWASDMMLRR